MPSAQVQPHLLCENCGAELPAGSYWCPRCGNIARRGPARLVISIVLLSIVAGFALTQWLVAYHRNLEMSLGQRWFLRGNQAMASKVPEVATEDYHNALAYLPQNPEYRLRLAEALVAQGHFAEARSHLLALWNEEPANGEANLELARLYAKKGDVQQAVRYYRNAINGVWNQDALDKRTSAGFELVAFLLAHGQRSQAQAELISLQADAPPDADSQVRLGNLLLEVGEYARAEQAFGAALRSDPKNAQAWLGSGEASTQLGDYNSAALQFSNAVRNDRGETGAAGASRLVLVKEILQLDPSLRGLSLAERARRVSAAFNVAIERLNSCANLQGYRLGPEVAAAAPMAAGQSVTAPPVIRDAPSSLQLLYTSGIQKKSDASVDALRRNPDNLEPTMDFVYRVMRATESSCPEETDQSRALMMMAKRSSETPS